MDAQGGPSNDYCPPLLVYMTYSLNSLEEDHIGDCIEEHYKAYEGDLRNLDNSSYMQRLQSSVVWVGLGFFLLCWCVGLVSFDGMYPSFVDIRDGNTSIAGRQP